MRITFSFLTILLFLSGCATAHPASAPAAAPSDSIAARTASMTTLTGFVPLHWDEKQGKIFMELRPGQEMIYQVSLAAGLGSNDIGLDRAQLGPTFFVRLDRVGPRLLMIQPNPKFGALSGDRGESEAVGESFASSVIWSFPIEVESEGRVLVDATQFFVRDAHGVAARLRDTTQGVYGVDAGRSAIYLPRTGSFPDNTEVEATVTLVTNDRPGNLVSSVAPTPESVTVREHHSLVRPPAPGYVPREFDPRSGFSFIEVYDYSTPFTAPLERRFIVRHRLQKKDPASTVSEPVRPIVYYVDNAAPEPIRTALLEGASWWKSAFEAAGFRGAFDVRILPEGADPLDIRYNVINWVHRSTRGWSYGASVVDPRTGEIIKGDVSLGSLRIRQDVLIGSGLIAPYEGPDPAVLATLDPSVSPSEMALARIRQLAAHEVGHTLGLAHNFAASTFGRASVMDYPAPQVDIRDGKLDLSNAYGKGIGAFDLFSIRYGYAQFAPGTEEKHLKEIVDSAVAAGMLFVSDEHSRDPGTAHPLGSVWDNGPDPIASLRHEMEVRRIALDNFGLSNLAPGRPLSDLEPIFLPLYLHHRYQLEAALKSLGGAYFTYAVREGSAPVPETVRRIVDPARQREALRLALETLDPKFLAIPQRILDLIPPPAAGTEGGTAERFERATTPMFDPIAAAQASAAITLNALLHPARAARLTRFHAESEGNPSLQEVTGTLVDRLVQIQPDANTAAIQRAVRRVAVAKLMDLAADPATDGEVKTAYEDALRELALRLTARPAAGPEAADRRSVIREIDAFLGRPLPPRTPEKVPAAPPGPPI